MIAVAVTATAGWMALVGSFVYDGTDDQLVGASTTNEVKGYTRSSTSVARGASGSTSNAQVTDPTAVGSVAESEASAATASGPPTTTPVVLVAPFTPPTLPPLVVPDRPIDQPVLVGVDAAVSSLNPHVIASAATANEPPASITLPRPFRAGTRGEPVLDTNYMVSVGVVSKLPFVVRYEIRPDAVWNDGTPVSCADFKLAWIAGTDTTGAFKIRNATGYRKIAAVGCGADGREITATFAETDADWQWLFDGIMPAHTIMDAAGVTDLNAAIDAATTRRLGEKWSLGFNLDQGLPGLARSAGPYVATETSGGQLTLSPNPSWWGTIKPERTVRLVQSPNVASALSAGEVQVVPIEPDGPLQGAIAAGRGAQVVAGVGTATDELVVNFRNPLLQQRALREALAACIERVGLVQSRVLPIVASALPSGNRMVRPIETGYIDTAATRLAGIERSRQLLTSAGYKFASDGLARKNGASLTVRILFNSGGSLRAGVVDGIAKQSAPAGITVAGDGRSASELRNAVQTGDFDLVLTTSSTTLSFADRLAPYLPSGTVNAYGYANSAIAALARQVTTELDETRRTQLLNDIDAKLWADVATIPLYTVPTLAVASQSVSGVAVVPGPAGPLGSAHAWR